MSWHGKGREIEKGKLFLTGKVNLEKVQKQQRVEGEGVGSLFLYPERLCM